MPSFAIGETDFLKDNTPFQVLSGALHYFRVHPEQWADRIHKARLMGLNTIETYVPWNAHAPRRGEFNATGQLDLGRFLDLVHAEGMQAIVRPGPYICAEWHDGGLPRWLLADSSLKLRSSDPSYLALIAEYLDAVYTIVAPRQIQHGGPVILVQIENEYGAYGSDRGYLQALADMTRERGIDVPLTTVDQPTEEMLGNGSLPSLHRTASFGSRSAQRLGTLRKHQPTGPLMCSEFWCGWFDSWGEAHRTTDAAESARDLDELLAAGASVNIYMFHGGSNFGFTSGANDKGTYRPIATSYDYDAPLAEDGTPTEKFWRFREVIAKYAPVPEETPPARVPAPSFDVPLQGSVPLWQLPLAGARHFDELPTPAQFSAAGGYSCYTTTIAAGGLLAFAEVRDRAQIFLNGAPVGTLSRDHHERFLPLPATAQGELAILLEDQGGVNYGPRLGEAKGLMGPVTLAGAPLAGWRVGTVDLDDLDAVRAALAAAPAVGQVAGVCGPAFISGTFELPEAADLFLDTAGWGKGVAWINGFNLGRYWNRGPQTTLHVPAPLLRSGRNELIVLETVGMDAAVARFATRPNLGPTEE